LGCLVRRGGEIHWNRVNRDDLNKVDFHFQPDWALATLF
jgi:hypothetical protein